MRILKSIVAVTCSATIAIATAPPKEQLDESLEEVIAQDEIPFVDSYTWSDLVSFNTNTNEPDPSGNEEVLDEIVYADDIDGFTEVALDESPIYRSSVLSEPGPFIEAPANFTGTSTFELFLRGLTRNEVRGSKAGSFGLLDGKKYTWLTYEEMDTQSRLFSRGLFEMELVQPDLRMLGIYSEHRIGWTITELAASRQNITLVPIYDTSRPDFVLSILQQTRVRTVVASVERAESLMSLISNNAQTSVRTIVLIGDDFDRINLFVKFPELNVRIFTLAEVKGMGIGAGSDQFPSRDDVNTICFTSGTTGEPKGVLVTHGMFIAVVGAAIKANLGLNFKDVHIAYLPPAHILERVVDLAIMYVGGKIGYHSGPLTDLASNMQLIRPTVLVGVPRVFEKSVAKVHAKIKNMSGFQKSVMNRGIAGASSANGGVMTRLVHRTLKSALGGRVRVILSGGGPLAPETQRELTLLFGVPVVQGYGMTETTGGTMISQIGSNLTGVVGIPLGCAEVKLVDLSILAILGQGAGELYIRGPAAFKGYFENPEATAATITKDGWVKTGDIARLVYSDSGEPGFKIVGRAKEIFKLANGEYVSPAYMEAEYKRCEMITEVFVDVSVDGKDVIAIVNVKENQDTAPVFECMKNIETELAKTTQKVNKVRNILVTDISIGEGSEFQTATMKLKRASIRKAFASEIFKL